MNILLTGGTGYIASHLATDLLENGCQVTLYDSLRNSQRSVVERISQITRKNVDFVEGDVRDTALLTNVLQEKKISAVCHFAGLKSVGESISHPLDYYSTNVAGTLSLLQAMESARIGTLVFSSTAALYGYPQTLPISEDHPTNPATPYGRSKLQCEQLLQDIASSSSLWKICCLRYFNPVGAHESGLIGEDPSGTPNNLLPYIARVANGQLPFLQVFGNDYPTPDGTGVRDYIHVMDLAEGHRAALNYLEQNSGCHVINLGTGKGFSVLEMLHAFEAASQKVIPFKIVERRNGDSAECYADATRAAQLLRWRTTRSLNDMCASQWKWQTSKNA